VRLERDESDMSQKLNLLPNILDCDSAYQTIIDMHKDLSYEESQIANVKLILALINHIGDVDILSDATKIARDNTLDWRKS